MTSDRDGAIWIGTRNHVLLRIRDGDWQTIDLPTKVGVPRVLILTTYQEADLIFNCLRAGANGYLLKEMPAEELIQAIQQVHSGGAPMSMQIARKVAAYFHELKGPQPDTAKLTQREQEILALLAKGYLYKEIADKLGISPNTMKSHQQIIYEKLHVQSRTEATLKYLGQIHEGGTNTGG